MFDETIMFDESCPNNVIFEKNKKEVGFRVLAHINPHLCERGWLLPVNGRIFQIGDKRYEVRTTEGLVGYPERIGIWATAIEI
jgi:hypothetical protein